MTGRLTSFDGRSWDLPPLLEWELRLTGGVPCDAFSVSFLYDKGMGAVLPDCTRFTAYENEKRIFFGVVDEYAVERSENGLWVTVCGRGLAALLLDNESEAAVYQRATTEELLRNHVTPYGIVCTQRKELAGAYQVESGGSQWKALEGFSRTYGGFSPRFTPTGELLLTPEETTLHRQLEDGSPILALRKREKRYGVLSEVLVVDKVRRSRQSVRNEGFASRGGVCRRVLYTPGQSSWAAMRYTGEYQLAESARDRVEIEVTLVGGFLASPGDRVALVLEELGLTGTYRVHEAVNTCGGSGTTCQLTLREG